MKRLVLILAATVAVTLAAASAADAATMTTGHSTKWSCGSAGTWTCQTFWVDIDTSSSGGYTWRHQATVGAQNGYIRSFTTSGSFTRGPGAGGSLNDANCGVSWAPNPPTGVTSATNAMRAYVVRNDGFTDDPHSSIRWSTGFVWTVPSWGLDNGNDGRATC